MDEIVETLEVNFDELTLRNLENLVEKHNDTIDNMIATGINVLAILDAINKLDKFM